MAAKNAKRVLRVSKETQPYRTELTPVSFLRRSAYVFPDKIAVVHGDRRYTYRQFEERANRLASGLRAAGLRHLDRGWYRSTRGSAATRSATSSSTPARGSSSWTTSWKDSSSRST